MLRRFRAHAGPWDMIIVGGGATGVGVAIDASTRGYDVLLLERSDFGKGTSSRSTKLVHGGVRYLEQGNVSLVMEALKERGLLARNAPHMVKNLAFVVPTYDWWESPFYGIGLKLYDLLAGKYGFGASRLLSREQTLERLPTLNTEGLRGGIVYYDGQFDDARLLIHMVLTAASHGSTLINYAEVAGTLADSEGFVNGVVFRDVETGETHEARGRVVINATGPFADALRRLAEPGVAPMIAPSQGIHLVFDSSFLPGDSAIMVPHTSDKRILFAIPWHGHTVVGTTDTPIAAPVEEPVAMEREIEFVLSTAALYLAKKPSRADVLSVFAGIRPLVKAGEGANTAALSRDHTIRIENSGMITICGGKWTTYRRMAEDCVNQAATLARLPDRPCLTETLPIHASEPLPPAAPLHPALPYTESHVIRAAREEMARSVEDVLARRTRALFLNTAAAAAMAPRVAELLEAETGRDPGLKRFLAVAGNYHIDRAAEKFHTGY